MNFWALLDAAADSGTQTEPSNGGFFGNYGVYIILAVIVVLLIVWFVFSGRKNKSRQKEYIEQLEAIRPGNKVKSAGGLCGIVVEVCDDNTVVIETGTELSGKSFLKLDKESIYQTDAKGPTQIAREQAEAAKAAQKAGMVPPSAPEEQETPSPAAEDSAPAADTPFEELGEPAEAPAEQPADAPAEKTDEE